MTAQVKVIGGRRYSFNGWMPTKEAVARYRKDRVGRTGSIRAFRGRSSTGKLGYLVYIRDRV